MKNHPMNYKRIYEELIEDRKKRNLSLLKQQYITEIHHIIPRCLGGTDDKENLVTLTTREHIIAHLLLERIYPENEKIVFSAFCMVNGFGPKDRVKESKTFSTRILSELRDKVSINVSKRYKNKENHPMFGKKHSEESRKKMSEARKKRRGFHHSQETREKMSKSSPRRKLSQEQKDHLSKIHLGMKASEETKKKMSESRKGEKHPRYGIHLSDETKKLISEAVSKNPGKAKKVFDSNNNIIFNTIRECAKYYNVTTDAINWWLKHKPEKGLKLLDKDDELPNDCI